MREIETGELLAEVGEEALRELLALLPDETEIVTVPREGALLLTFREGLGERFHLGEALAATCRVRCRGREGWGAVLGGDPRRALVAATLNALEQADDRPPELSAARTVLDRERARVMSARHRTAALAASTRVEFDLLPGA